MSATISRRVPRDSAYTNLELYGVVRTVAERVHPDEPTVLTQVEFDRAKAVCGFADAPTARGIYGRLKTPERKPTPWRKIVADACRGDVSALMVEQARTRESGDQHLDERFVHYSLRRVAAYLGAETVHRSEYEPARAALIAEDVKRWGADARLADLLITSGQILTVCGSWEAALVLAGLAERGTRKKDASMGWLEAIGHFVAHNARIPSAHELKRTFAPKAGFTLTTRELPYTEYVDQYRAQCAARGEEIPPGPPGAGRPKDGTRPIVVPEGGIAGPGSKPRGYWTAERCLDALAEWDASLPSRARRTGPAYLTAREAAEPGTYPSMDTLQLHCGTFTKAMAEVRSRRREEKAA